MKINIFILLVLFPLIILAEGTLFVGLEGSEPPTFYSDMEGFPNVTWNQHFSMDVSGAAATFDGRIYLCEGAFTTHLYQAGLDENPLMLCTIEEDMSALAYGRDTLWGYSNYASPRGIYSIDTDTGATELALDVGNYRFFALDYNPVDDLFYGYTEYGGSGLYSINIDSGEMIQLVGSIPATNGQGRGMAVGDNTVFLTATRGDDGIPYFAYDISQGAGGEWIEFPNPYPEYHSTGGAAWIAEPDETVMISGQVTGSDAPEMGLANSIVSLSGEYEYETITDENGYFSFQAVQFNLVYDLQTAYEGYEIWIEEITVQSEDIDLGTIILDEIAYPVINVIAEETLPYNQVTLSWETTDERELEDFTIYRFLEDFSSVPALWEMLAENYTDTIYIDDEWAELEAEFYQYAVISNYTNGIISDPVFSNVIEKIQTELDDQEIHNTLKIKSVYPNPFNPSVRIEYSLDLAAEINLSIYNIKGQLVKNLVKGWQKADKYQIEWRGEDIDHNQQASGIYLLNFEINGRLHEMRKLIMLK